MVPVIDHMLYEATPTKQSLNKRRENLYSYIKSNGYLPKLGFLVLNSFLVPLRQCILDKIKAGGTVLGYGCVQANASN